MRHIIWRNRASAILGILVMIIPFTGLPASLRTAFIVLFGLIIAVFGFSKESMAGYSYDATETKPEGKDAGTEPIAEAHFFEADEPIATDALQAKKRTLRKEMETVKQVIDEAGGAE